MVGKKKKKEKKEMIDLSIVGCIMAYILALVSVVINCIQVRQYREEIFELRRRIKNLEYALEHWVKEFTKEEKK